MFSSHHAIYQFCDKWAALDDWLPYAEELVKKWASQDSKDIKFVCSFDIQLAAYLLMDDLLPAPAKTALAALTLDAIAEAEEKKYTIDCLGVKPPPPGRKKDLGKHHRFREVKELICSGTSPTEAYKQVAKKYHKSTDTIRREYERTLKKQKEKRGKIKK